MYKKILVINDISCIGKCSLNVALPILSAFGHQVTILPTVLLSSQTSGLKPYRAPLTDSVLAIGAHWNDLNLDFDIILTGYMANCDQVDHIIDLVDRYKTDKTLVIVDPVMADNGKMYCGFDQSYVQKMRQLIMRADIITPNTTEATLLAGSDQPQAVYSALGDLVPSIIVTSVYNGGQIGAVIADQSGTTEVMRTAIKGTFHGAGDIFASFLTGCLADGLSLLQATQKATEFVWQAIASTPSDADPRFGLSFEIALKNFIKNCA